MPGADDKTITFYAVGDFPYGDLQHYELRRHLNDLHDLPNSGQAKFVVHLGDVMRSSATHSVHDYVAVRRLLAESPHPVYLVPGDNDWSDAKDWTAALGHWNEHLGRLYEEWSDHIPPTTTTSGDNMYFFFPIHKPLFTVFIGVNLPAGPGKAWEREAFRRSDDHLKHVLDKYDKSDLDALVVFGHGTVQDEAFFTRLRDFGNKHKDLPILYLHGEGHTFHVRPYAQGDPDPWFFADNQIHCIEVDGNSENKHGGPKPVRPLLKVTITGSREAPFEFDRVPWLREKGFPSQGALRRR